MHGDKREWNFLYPLLDKYYENTPTTANHIDSKASQAFAPKIFGTSCTMYDKSRSCPTELADGDTVYKEHSSLTNHGRLRTLLSQIRPAEVRFLKQELCAKTFETDGIPLLPENVLAHIALDLDIVDLVRFRRVSKKWKMAWEIAPVYKDLLRKYSYVSYEKVYKSLPHDSPLLKELFDSRAERIDALRCGRVASVFTVPFDSGNKMGRGPASTVYHAGRIARMVNSNSAVVVVNLRSYESKTYQTAQRVGLTNYQLSSTHLVGTSFR